VLPEKYHKIKFSRLQPVAFTLLLCFALPLVTLAQGPDDPEDTPIDGGLSLLLAAGVGYGVKKYKDVKKAGRKSDDL
jgi:hypothetical protein